MLTATIFLALCMRESAVLELPRGTWCLEGQRPPFGYFQSFLPTVRRPVTGKAHGTSRGPSYAVGRHRAGIVERTPGNSRGKRSIHGVPNARAHRVPSKQCVRSVLAWSPNFFCP
jgi:hypothetical protein